MLNSRVASENMNVVLVDGHVHFHPLFDVDRVLDSALTNFRAAASHQGVLARSEYVLMLTESSGHDYFAAFDATVGETHARPWRFTRTEERASLVAQRVDGGRLTLVAGRQIAASGGLEVLALGTDHRYRDGGGFFDTIRQVLDDGAVAVVPWGFGKWRFRRGRQVAQAIHSLRGRAFFLGDNGGRLRYGSAPHLFGEARRLGIWTLPGSDPLPLRHHQTRVGTYGFALRIALDPTRPAAAITEHLIGLSNQPPIYGELESLPRFCVSQATMQLRKHVTHRRRD